jgi:hypothetical protein
VLVVTSHFSSALSSTKQRNEVRRLICNNEGSEIDTQTTAEAAAKGNKYLGLKMAKERDGNSKWSEAKR